MQKIEWLFLVYFFFPQGMRKKVTFVSQGLSVQITIT